MIDNTTKIALVTMAIMYFMTRDIMTALYAAGSGFFSTLLVNAVW